MRQWDENVPREICVSCALAMQRFECSACAILYLNRNSIQIYSSVVVNKKQIRQFCKSQMLSKSMKIESRCKLYKYIHIYTYKYSLCFFVCILSQQIHRKKTTTSRIKQLGKQPFKFFMKFYRKWF